jgi:hypothetical protein
MNNRVKPVGIIRLPVKLKEEEKEITMCVDWYVISAKADRSLIIGRPTQARYGIVVSPPHGAIFFNTPGGQATIHSISISETLNSTRQADVKNELQLRLAIAPRLARQWRTVTEETKDRKGGIPKVMMEEEEHKPTHQGNSGFGGGGDKRGGRYRITKQVPPRQKRCNLKRHTRDNTSRNIVEIPRAFTPRSNIQEATKKIKEENNLITRSIPSAQRCDNKKTRGRLGSPPNATHNRNEHPAERNNQPHGKRAKASKVAAAATLTRINKQTRVTIGGMMSKLNTKNYQAQR